MPLSRLLAVVLAFLALTARAEVIDIDNTQLAKLVASGVPVVDIRTAPEWKETGVVAGSRLLTFFDEKGQFNAAAWLEKLKATTKPDQPVILICRSGNRTQKVSQFLAQQAGYKTVYNVRDGIRGWSKEGRPLTPAPSDIVCAPPRNC